MQFLIVCSPDSFIQLKASASGKLMDYLNKKAKKNTARTPDSFRLCQQRFVCNMLPIYQVNTIVNRTHLPLISILK